MKRKGDKRMQIGHARICLTPTEPFYLIGYRSKNRYEASTGVHDDIYANALLCNDGEKMLFLFSADVLEFEEDMAEDVKTMLQSRFGIERDMVLLCATHNHSSIVSYHKSWYTGKYDAAYAAWFQEAICDCFQECLNNQQEASAKIGSQVILGYYGNRNHPGVPADNEVIVVKFYDQNGIPFAGFVNWAVHSTLISAENTQLTSELAGNVSIRLHDAFGFYPAMIVGAAGDCSNRHERQGNDFKELQRVSSALASIIQEISMQQSITMDKLYCQTLFHTIHHDMAFVHEEVKLELEKLAQQKKQVNDAQIPHIEQRMEELAKKLDAHEFHLDAKGSVISLGELQLFVFPGELGSAFGKQLKQECETNAIICGYTNGYYEYFMPRAEYGTSFETIASPIPAGEAEKMMLKYIQASKLLTAEKI